MLHWLILIPYYFIGTITVTALLSTLCRLTRLNLSANTLIRTAVVCTLVLLVGPLWLGWISSAFFTTKGLILLLALSFVLAGLDAALRKKLPLAMDHELRGHA